MGNLTVGLACRTRGIELPGKGKQGRGPCDFTTQESFPRDIFPFIRRTHLPPAATPAKMGKTRGLQGGSGGPPRPVLSSALVFSGWSPHVEGQTPLATLINNRAKLTHYTELHPVSLANCSSRDVINER